MKRLILSALVLIVLAGAGFIVWYFRFRTPVPQVSLRVTKPDRVLVGEPFALTISYRNDSEQTLRNAKLAFALPEGVSALGYPPDRRVIEQAQGDLTDPLGNLGTLRFVATDGARSLKHIEIRLRYSVTDDSGSQIETKTDADVTIGEPAAALSLQVPEQVVAGDTFVIKAEYRNDSKEVLDGTTLQFDAGEAFHFQSAEPAKEGASWNLGRLLPHATGTIAISGNVTETRSPLSLRLSFATEIEGQAYTIAETSREVRVAAPLLSLEIYANGKQDAIVAPGDRVQYELRYKNNANVSLQNVTLDAALTGSLFDYQSLEPGQGVFNSVNNVMSWNSANIPELASLAPGAEGSVAFSLYTKRDIVIRRLGDKHFLLKIRSTIQSPSVPAGVAGTKTFGTAALDTKVAGKTELTTIALFYDSASGISNKGPFPPRVNTPTQFTVHWKVKNYWNDVSGVKVVAKLEPGVRFTGTVKSTAGTKPVYQASTGEVSWEIPRLVATQGILSAPAEAIFQVEITPAVNQIGRRVSLLGRSTLSAHDDFTGATLTSGAEEKTTDLGDDPKASALGGGEVVP